MHSQLYIMGLHKLQKPQLMLGNYYFPFRLGVLDVQTEMRNSVYIHVDS